mgnify:CR=1 FL=1
MIDHESVKRFPLEWPTGWTRTSKWKRQRAAFRQTKTDTMRNADGSSRTVKRDVQVSVFVATQRLERQIEMLGGKTPRSRRTSRCASTGGHGPRASPMIRASRSTFRSRAQATVLACDRFVRVGDNIAAIAGHIDALRRVERYGVRHDRAGAGRLQGIAS